MEMDRRRHILLVDDESEVLSTVSFLLESEGFLVTTAENGKKAFEIIESSEGGEKEPFDLVVSDLVMPEMGGLELVEAIGRAQIPLPVLVCTGYGDKSTVIDLMRRGCGDYLDKPFQPKDLLLRVKALLGKSVKRGISSKGEEKERSLKVEEDSGWQTITPSGDIAGSTADQLRLLLVGMLDNGKLLYRFDLKNVNEITVDTLAVFLCFTRMLREHYKSSRVEMLNANKFVAALLHSGELTGPGGKSKVGGEDGI